MGSVGDQDWPKIRRRILKYMEAHGPQSSDCIIAAFKGKHSMNVIRMALRFMEQDRQIYRSNNRHAWQCNPDRLLLFPGEGPCE